MIRKATIIDVAKRAGVSWKTVSRVVNREPNVRAATAEKVREAIAALDYQPNQAARSLAGARSYLIGAIAANPSSHYMAALYRGAARACRERGYHLTLEEIDLQNGDPAALLERSLQRVKLDGVILCPPASDSPSLLELLDRLSIAYVRIDPLTCPDRSPSIAGDDEQGVAELVDHLWTVGYRSFGIVEGPPNHRAAHVRRSAFEEALRTKGIEPADIGREKGDFSFQSGFAAGEALLSSLPSRSAIFACNDEMAAGVIAACGEKGINVPGDVAIAGFDDSEIASLIWPPLTTVHQPIEDYARVAVELLVDGTPQRQPPPRTVLPVRLITRRSTG
ncbi:LacI family DNA-binding transcriptional regulator [Sphingobium ummariense]|uniref:HTH lacI-type domain-containing protein n=1 Tax=Sphingobium ummariense RL-3 TaxID=1346791 RepID=T0IV22_9SPHN|nr:LacI family DNA-binding transcriptional regulator [Sphingobium ummariense]EQB32655.1 hypothetical protein M529_08285 [Sphingobium ummariense RL-3]